MLWCYCIFALLWCIYLFDLMWCCFLLSLCCGCSLCCGALQFSVTWSTPPAQVIIGLGLTVGFTVELIVGFTVGSIVGSVGFKRYLVSIIVKRFCFGFTGGFDFRVH